MSGTAILVLACVITAGILLCLLRMFRGPTVADRAAAMDTACTVTTALLVLLALFFKRSVYLDVALVYSLLTFMGLVAIARYLERGV